MIGWSPQDAMATERRHIFVGAKSVRGRRVLVDELIAKLPRRTCAHGQRNCWFSCKESLALSRARLADLASHFGASSKRTSDAVEKRALKSGAALHHVAGVPRCELSSTADVQTGRHGVDPTQPRPRFGRGFLFSGRDTTVASAIERCDATMGVHQRGCLPNGRFAFTQIS